MRIIYCLLLAFCLQTTWAIGNVHRHDNHSLANALKTGTDTNGQPLYLCIAKLFNSTQPGKTWEGYGRCNVPYGGKEYIVDQFEIPSREMFSSSYWQGNSRLAVTVGRDTNGEPLFLCQAFFKGSKQPGKTWPGYNHCNISYAGHEIIMDNYRVLVNDRNYGNTVTEHHHGHLNKANEQCVQNPFGDKACGYNCIQSMNRVACATSPDQQCVADNFGHIACGYGCVKSPFKVTCAGRHGYNCVINRFNEIRCGRNCRVDRFNHIHCDN